MVLHIKTIVQHSEYKIVHITDTFIHECEGNLFSADEDDENKQENNVESQYQNNNCVSQKNILLFQQIESDLIQDIKQLNVTNYEKDYDMLDLINDIDSTKTALKCLESATMLESFLSEFKDEVMLNCMCLWL